MITSQDRVDSAAVSSERARSELSPPVSGEKACLRCGSALVARLAGRGRPPSYCSTACRRAAEYELRRVQQGLASLEERARRYRLGWFGRSKEPPPEIDEERRRLEERLRALLEGEG